MTTRNFSTSKYDRVSSFYDWLANLYSQGQIAASKASQIEEIESGSRVLYAGVGRGEDAVLAALHGAKVTIIDLSPSMLNQAQQKFKNEGVEDDIEVVCDNIMNFTEYEQYDVIAANFFLNVFSESSMLEVFQHLVKLLKPGGKFMIADFSPLSKNWFTKVPQSIYSYSGMIFFWILAGSELHKMYKYEEYFAELGLEFSSMRKFRVFRNGPAWYRSVTALKI